MNYSVCLNVSGKTTELLKRTNIYQTNNRAAGMRILGSGSGSAEEKKPGSDLKSK